MSTPEEPPSPDDPGSDFSPGLRAVWEAHRRGEDARELQEQVSLQRHLLEKHPPFPPLLKALLHRLHGLPRWSVRPPLEEVSKQGEEHLATQMETLAQ